MRGKQGEDEEKVGRGWGEDGETMARQWRLICEGNNILKLTENDTYGKKN